MDGRNPNHQLISGELYIPLFSLGFYHPFGAGFRNHPQYFGYGWIGFLKWGYPWVPQNHGFFHIDPPTLVGLPRYAILNQLR